MPRRMVVVVLALVVQLPSIAGAHDGPPFPIVSDAAVGRYLVSIWTDPDATDDESAGGQFWVRIADRQRGSLPDSTRARVAVRPLDGPGAERATAATPVRGDITNQFAAVVMDHEGRFAVRVAIEGPLGEAVVDGEVQATYDLRPPAYMIALYLAPFVAVGLLWMRLLLRRRRHPSRR